MIFSVLGIVRSLLVLSGCGPSIPDAKRFIEN